MSEPEPDDHVPKPLMGRTFWVMLVFAFVCVVAGAAVAFLAPRLFPQAPAPTSEGPFAPGRA